LRLHGSSPDRNLPDIPPNTTTFLHSLRKAAKMGFSEETGSNGYHTHLAKASNAFNTPPIETPPRAMTPPLGAEKRQVEIKSIGENSSRRASGALGGEAIDPSALKKALKNFEEAGRPRDVTPGGSPSRKRQRVYGDR